ncbi:MAG: hypothetical protein HY075_14915 [Deltaproteobacteria bacterium]|nr:hypothetical protein [Deltaproteobacteria bacterium]
MKRAFLFVLALLACTAQARAETVDVNFLAIDLNVDPNIGVAPKKAVAINLDNYPKPAANGKECWNTSLSVRSDDKAVKVTKVGAYDLDPPFEFKCPKGVNFNIASSLKKKDDATALDVGRKLSTFLDSLDDFVSHAAKCGAGGDLNFEGGFSDNSSDPLKTSIAALAGANAKIFDSAKVDAGSVTVSGGEILKTLGVKEISCVSKGAFMGCHVKMPNSPKAECKPGSAASTADASDPKNVAPGATGGSGKGAGATAQPQGKTKL